MICGQVAYLVWLATPSKKRYGIKYYYEAIFSKKKIRNTVMSYVLSSDKLVSLLELAEADCIPFRTWLHH